MVDIGLTTSWHDVKKPVQNGQTAQQYSELRKYLGKCDQLPNTPFL
jgi:hypothetical protein